VAYTNVITVSSHTKKDNPPGLPSTPYSPSMTLTLPYVLIQNGAGQARELLEAALDVFQKHGNRYSEAQTLRLRGEVLAAEARESLRQGDRTTAERTYTRASLTLEHAAERFRLRHEDWEEARCLRAAGDVGDPRNGLRELVFVRNAKGMLEGLGDTWGVARTLLSEGAALARLGRNRIHSPRP
jgi:hypothetical protein